MDEMSAATAANELPDAWPLQPALLVQRWMEEAHACDLLAAYADTPHTASVAARLRHRAKALTLAARNLGLWLDGDPGGLFAMESCHSPLARSAEVDLNLRRGDWRLMQAHQYLMGVDEEIRQAMLLAVVAHGLSKEMA